MLAVPGLLLLEYGLWQWWEPLAWIVAGLFLLGPFVSRVVERVR